MEGESIGGWLEALASSAPAPGGGAAAALEAAMAAALLEMVCNLTIGKPAYAEHDDDDDLRPRPRHEPPLATRSGSHRRTRRRSAR